MAIRDVVIRDDLLVIAAINGSDYVQVMIRRRDQNMMAEISIPAAGVALIATHAVLVAHQDAIGVDAGGTAVRGTSGVRGDVPAKLFVHAGPRGYLVTIGQQGAPNVDAHLTGPEMADLCLILAMAVNGQW